MTERIHQLSYDTYPTGYFQGVRPEMLRFVPAHCRRVLEVGCAEGAFGESLRTTRKIEVWGVEPNKPAAAKAKARLDRVIEGVFGPEIALPAEYFDCVVFNDVLEHMLAPEMALRYAKGLLTPSGVVVASIPNIRFLPMVYKLMIHARWEYEDSGILDKTHLRFFTRSSIVNIFEREGFAIDTVCGIHAWEGSPHTRWLLWWRAFKLANVIFFNKFGDMRFLQFAVVAKPMVQLVEKDNSHWNTFLISP
jgi:2-polyprenyl-3-methyl-5-hydroxy-6-metoxy-1,4-benzoquinol methylase